MVARAFCAFVALAAFTSEDRSATGANQPAKPFTLAELAGEWGTTDGAVRLTLEVREERLYLALDNETSRVRGFLNRTEANGPTFRAGRCTLTFTDPSNGTLTFGTADAMAITRRSSLTPAALAGKYTRGKPDNDWHYGTIEVRPRLFGVAPRVRWVNKAGVAWELSLNLDRGELLTGKDCPYYDTNPADGRSFRIARAMNADGSPRPEIEGFHFLGEFYRKERMPEKDAKAGTGSALTDAEAKEVMDYHNTIRKAVGVEPVKWSPDVAKFAQAWANEIARTGDVKHRPYDEGVWKQKYGENIGWGGGAYTAMDAAKGWQSEIKFYTPGTAIPQDFASFQAGHYTQMVWKASTEVGAGKAVIQAGQFKGWTVHVCNYNPPGNVLGQKPY